MSRITEYPGTGMREYLFPLRPDVRARFVLPRDLTTAEVERLTAFLAALVWEPLLDAPPDRSAPGEGT